MSDIQSLIKMLQSNNPAKRYDACESLRVSPSLPYEALEALRLVTNDSNPDVADAARRAIELHASYKDILQSGRVDDEPMKQTHNTKKARDLVRGLFGWFLIGNLVLILEYLYPSFSQWNILGVPVVTVIVIGILLLMKRNWLAYGIVAAAITNTLVMILVGILNEIPYLGALLLWGLSLPLPLGLLMLFQA
jgi:hypothetical protein